MSSSTVIPADTGDDTGAPAPAVDRRPPRPSRATRARRRVAGAVRGVPGIVWSVTALHLMLLLAYSVVLPTYRAPDEPLHVDLAHLFSEETTYPRWDARDLGPGVHRSLRVVKFGSGSQHLTAADAPPKDQRPSIEELEDPPVRTGINQLPQHPPLYYMAIGGGMWVGERILGDPIGGFDLETWVYRAMTLLFVAPLPLVIWRVARLLGAPRGVAVAATIVPLAIPQYLHIGSAVNNDSLQLLLFWLLTPVVLRMARGELGPRTAVLAGTITGLGLLTKGFAVVMPFWVLAALVVALRRSGRAGLRPATVAGLAYGATCLVVGGWWWIRNVILYGEPLPSRFGEMLRDRGDSPVDVADFVHRWAYTTTRRFWGAFGWFDVYLPTIAITLATIVCVVALVAFCARRDRVAHTPVGDRLVLVAPFLLLLVTQFSLSFRRYLESGQLPGLQGRYWFPALAALAIAIALGLGNLVRRHIDRLPLAVLAAAGAMQLVAGVTIMRHYWGAPGVDITERIRAAVAWSPLPGELLATGAVVAAVVGIVTTVQVAAMAIGRRGDPGDAADQAVAAT